MDAPDWAEAVRAALAQELGKGAVPWLAPAPPAATATVPADPEPQADGKGQAPFKEAAAAPVDDAESFWPSVGVSGLYVVMPSQRGARAPIAGVVQRVILSLKEIPKRPSSPLTRHIPG